MKNTFKVLFYIKRSTPLRDGTVPIICRITVRGERAQFSTRLSIAPHAWDAEQARAVGRSPELIRINRSLDELYLRIIETRERLIERWGTISAQQLHDALSEDGEHATMLLDFFAQHNRTLLRQVGVDLSRSTYYKYSAVEQHLRAYLASEQLRGDLPLDRFDRELLIGFHGYLLRALHHRKNTVSVYLSALKRVLTLARRQGFMQRDPFSDYKVQTEYVRRNFLTTDELTRLISLTDLTPSRQLVRDAFLFSCFTGLSFIDLKLLRREHLRYIGPRCWIETTRRKTGSQVQVPLFELPRAILQKYASKDPAAPIFRLPSNGWCNSALRDLMRAAAIPKHITFHAARHTFATTLTLSQGIPIETIAHLLGHRNIRTTQIYATVTHDYLNMEMSRLSKRIDPLGEQWQA